MTYGGSSTGHGGSSTGHGGSATGHGGSSTGHGGSSIGHGGLSGQRFEDTKPQIQNKTSLNLNFAQISGEKHPNCLTKTTTPKIKVQRKGEKSKFK